MVNHGPGLDATFGALADPTRRAILASLAGGKASVSQLAQPYSMSLPAVLKHLAILENARLVRCEKNGRVRECWLSAEPIKEAIDWLAQYRAFWEMQLDSLDRYLTAKKIEEDECQQGKLRPIRSKSSGRSPRRGSRSSGPGPTRTN